MMLKSRVYLSLVAAGVGFGLSLLVTRHFGKAFLTGSITLIAAQVGAVAMESKYDEHLHIRSEKLRSHIRSLQHRRQAVYQELQQLSAERDRTKTELYLQQAQPIDPNPWQPQAKTPERADRPQISWTLTDPSSPLSSSNRAAAQKTPSFQSNGLETRVQPTHPAGNSAPLPLNPPPLEDSLQTRKAELQRLKGQITEQQSKQENLSQVVTGLTQQRSKLDTDLTYLQTQVQELEQYRASLTQFFEKAEPKRREVETGSKALQDAIAQLQAQISSLHRELGLLEKQILDRRTEKDQLDQQLITLRDQQMRLDSPGPIQPAPPPSLTPSNSTQPLNNQPKLRRTPSKTPSKSPQLGSEWMALMQAMTGSEFHALRAIAIEENPGPTLKRLSEENLTMPELLIDAINERALDTIGDIILEPGPDTHVSIIAQEYRDQVATLISTYASP
jgi:uncharacterized protein YlxW (UPF0749 family)